MKSAKLLLLGVVIGITGCGGGAAPVKDTRTEAQKTETHAQHQQQADSVKSSDQ